MATTQYISKFSGVDIDKAVAYYNGIKNQGERQLVSVNVGISDWAESDEHAAFKVTIRLSGILDTGAADVYFIQSSESIVGAVGQRWNVDYVYSTGVNGNENYSQFICYSNIKIEGSMVFMAIATPTQNIEAEIVTN